MNTAQLALAHVVSLSLPSHNPHRSLTLLLLLRIFFTHRCFEYLPWRNNVSLIDLEPGSVSLKGFCFGEFVLGERAVDTCLGGLDASPYHDVKDVSMIASPLFKVPSPVKSSVCFPHVCPGDYQQILALMTFRFLPFWIPSCRYRHRLTFGLYLMISGSG